PVPGYPPEEGCYLRGNDYSPVAVCVILRWIREETPPDIERLVRIGVETGAALAGTLQTENIGIEKMLCNLVANPNIRHLVVCGPESPGHLVGDAITALAANGVDESRRIAGARGPTPYLFNIPIESIERFRRQVGVLNLIDEGSPDVLREAIRACYQELPTPFRDYELHDPGAFEGPPLSGGITWRVTNPERQPKNRQEEEQRAKLQKLMERVRRTAEERKPRRRQTCGR
ncbi:MAG: tetrahydromethanopterin S-methyltransferase subunit A, partial [Acidobacteria bacterium]|nr:tetrahydromethanopterin S-methyltransferase subunit A [Acidobacteriota bacterium]